jgi:hypothetical protein
MKRTVNCDTTIERNDKLEITFDTKTEKRRSKRIKYQIKPKLDDNYEKPYHINKNRDGITKLYTKDTINDHVVDGLNMIHDLLNHLDQRWLNEENIPLFVPILIKALIYIMSDTSSDSVIHFVLKDFTVWESFLEHFIDRSSDMSHECRLYYVYPDDPLDKECDDRLVMDLAKALSEKYSVTVVSKDRYGLNHLLKPRPTKYMMYKLKRGKLEQFEGNFPIEGDRTFKFPHRKCSFNFFDSYRGQTHIELCTVY